MLTEKRKEGTLNLCKAIVSLPSYSGAEELGPSTESLAHTVDEYIEISQLYDAVKGYYSIMESLLIPSPGHRSEQH